MSISSRFQRIADDGEAEGVIDQALQSGSSIVAPFYAFFAGTKRTFHRFGIFAKETLPVVTLSVGNITMGGTGKTPFTIWLARFVQSEGHNPVVLSRGYQRENEDELTVVHNGRKLKANATKGGDEPVMIAKSLKNIPVVACSNRYLAGKFALKRLQVDTAILDDGMQHHRLQRQGEFVLLDTTKPLDSLKLFPRGTLREPVSSLGRAHLLVLTRCDSSLRSKSFVRMIKRRFKNIPAVRTRLVLKGFERLADEKRVAKKPLQGKPVYLVCGVGNPNSVKRTLEENGFPIMEMKAYQDHAAYTKDDIASWIRAAKRAGAERIIVTEKDAVKLLEMQNDLPNGLPKRLYSMRVELQFITKKEKELAEKTVRSRLRVQPVRGFLK